MDSWECAQCGRTNKERQATCLLCGLERGLTAEGEEAPGAVGLGSATGLARLESGLALLSKQYQQEVTLGEVLDSDEDPNGLRPAEIDAVLARVEQTLIGRQFAAGEKQQRA